MPPSDALLAELKEYTRTTVWGDLSDPAFIGDSPYRKIPKEHREIFWACITLMTYFTTKELGGWTLKFGKPERFTNCEIGIDIE